MQVLSKQSIEAVPAPCEAPVAAVFEDADLDPGVAALDGALGGVISEARALEELRAKVGETLAIPTLGRLAQRRVVVVGLGKRAVYTAEAVRRAAAGTCRALERCGARSAAVLPVTSDAVPAEAWARAFTEGVLLRSYRFDGYRSEDQPARLLESLYLLGTEPKVLEQGIQIGTAMAAGANCARDLANEPPNVLYPEELARRATALAATYGLDLEILAPAELEERGMNALLAVGRGSSREPRMIALHYRARGAEHRPTLGLVGKGITFDTGGISLKPGADMHIMKTDMGGAAAMLGAMQTIATLKPHLNVTMLAASAENMPDGAAFRPGDILRAKNGKTIEVQNTDAEGRLVLADALSYSVELGLSPIIDAATLTGACSVALGPYYSACFSNDTAVREALLGAAAHAGERFWPMPLDPDYRPLLDSSCADMRNVGGREGGAITAAMFLQEFVGTQPWAHLDIAPTAFADTELAYYAKGLATGHPSRTIAQLALDLAGAE